MNAAMIRAIAAELPQGDHVKVEIAPWNKFGAVLVEIGEGESCRSLVVRRDGAAFPWTGDLGDLLSAALDAHQPVR